jgi:hypothetical protein
MFYRGQKVVCITDYGLPDCPANGAVCTISEVLENPDLTGRPLWCEGLRMPTSWLDLSMGNVWFRLVEIPDAPHYFRSVAFRPVRPTSIEQFRKLLEPAPEAERV